jgi:arginine-tRNA-protein transferase
VNDFRPTRSQQRTIRKHADLIAQVTPLEFKDEHFTLYQAYQNSRHSNPLDGQEFDSIEDEEDQYRQFLIQSHIDSFLVEFRQNGTLRMVSVIDIVQNGLSSVYTFYDTSLPQASLGTFGILWQIHEAKIRKLPYVYLGYYIQESKKMSYKINFQPLEGLIAGQWGPLISSNPISSDPKII